MDENIQCDQEENKRMFKTALSKIKVSKCMRLTSFTFHSAFINPKSNLQTFTNHQSVNKLSLFFLFIYSLVLE